MRDIGEQFRFYDFFAGAGLVTLALADRWRCIWANDVDERKASVYRANFGCEHFHLGDVATVKATDLPRPVDLAWASFPCQDLSLAGWRRGLSAERSGTFWAFWRLMRDLHRRGERPAVIAIENVNGLLHGDHFRALCEAVAALGMQFGALVMDARWFVPQSRPRVFVVAADTGLDVSGLTSDRPVAPWTPGSLIAAHSAIGRSAGRLWRWWNIPPPAGPRCGLGALIERRNRWDSQEQANALLRMMTPRNRMKVLSNEGRIGFLYRRTREGVQRAEVRFDGLAGCLRTPAGGSSRQTVVTVDKGEFRSRLLSAREAARLMGVPDHFRLPQRYNEAYHAMGDGVAVPVVRWLSDHLLIPLAERARAL